MDDTTARTPDEGPQGDDATERPESPQGDDATRHPESPQGGDATQRPEPDEDATRVIRGDEADTRIWSADEAGATRVMREGADGNWSPPAATTPPPLPPPPTPPRPQPTLVMSRSARQSSGSAWWIILPLIVAVLAVAAVWFVWLRGEEQAAPIPVASPTPQAWAGAWARTDGLGGGLVIEGAGETYQATAYDGDLQPGGSVVAVATADGTELRFTLPAHPSFEGPPGPLEAMLTIDSDPDAATLQVIGADGSALAMPLQRVSSLTSASPSMSPSPTAAPTPAPSPSPSPSPTPSPSPSEEGLRQQMFDAIADVQAGVEAWAAANGGAYPMPADVREGGAVAQYIDPWPMDPWVPTQFLAPGNAPGGYSYEQLEGGLAYTLRGYLDNGSYVVP